MQFIYTYITLTEMISYLCSVFSVVLTETGFLSPPCVSDAVGLYWYILYYSNFLEYFLVPILCFYL
jgi:hypothetical protein